MFVPKMNLYCKFEQSKFGGWGVRAACYGYKDGYDKAIKATFWVQGTPKTYISTYNSRSMFSSTTMLSLSLDSIMWESK